MSPPCARSCMAAVVVGLVGFGPLGGCSGDSSDDSTSEVPGDDDAGSPSAGSGEEGEADDGPGDSSNDDDDSEGGVDTGGSEGGESTETGEPAGPCDDIVPTGGFGIGDVVPNVELMDQDGNLVSLHDFCEVEVFLFSAAFW